jgi:integrase
MASETWEFDKACPGLSIRAQGQARTWVVWFTVGGKRGKLSLGSVASLTRAKARQKANEIVLGARNGVDPRAERRAAKAKAADSFGAMIRAYLERRAKPRQRPRTYIETARYLERYWAPLHGHPVESITRRELAARLEQIRVEHGAGAAEKARVYLGMSYSWAMRAGLVEQNRTIGLESAPAARRERVLTPAELRIVWSACDGDFGELVKLLILTGQRRTEVAGLHETELDRERGVWRIPAARAKNAREHEVPLSSQAMKLIAGRPGPYLFGRGGRTPYSGFSRAKARLDQGAGIAPWTLHDLRRTAVTQMAEVGVEPHVIEAVVNHVSGHKGGIAGHYNFARYREQKRAALQRWADWLEAVVEGRQTGAKVIRLGA